MVVVASGICRLCLPKLVVLSHVDLTSTSTSLEFLVTHTTFLTRADDIDADTSSLPHFWLTVPHWARLDLHWPVEMERLPVELVEQLVKSLVFKDICNLRLVSRDIHAKATQRRFRSFAPRTKLLHITVDHLRTFAAATQTGGIGCAVERVELVVVHEQNHSSSEAADSELVRLLTKAFDNLHANSSSGLLASLELTVHIHKHGIYWTPEALSDHYDLAEFDQTSVWETSSRAFHVVLAALSASRLHIDELKIFSQVSQWSIRCDQLSNRLSSSLIWPTLPHTKRLALSLSGSLARSDENAKHVIRFLTAFPNLESLELQWFSLEGLRMEQRITADNILTSVSMHICLPQLTSLTFEGFRADSETLWRFMRNRNRP